MTRVDAKKVVFQNVTFAYTRFVDCYFRNCKFTSCTFIGCKFTDSNLSGSTFENCDFRYASFQTTFISDLIIKTNAPQQPNLQLKFARSLRLNYSSLGIRRSARKANLLENEASRAHQKQIFQQATHYHRSKYTFKDRTSALGKYTLSQLNRFIWGEGENPWLLLPWTLLVLSLVVVSETWRTDLEVTSAVQATFATLVGVAPEISVSLSSTVVLTLWRYLLISFGATAVYRLVARA